MKRSGAGAVYIAIWDIDVYDFIDLKKKNGDERRRAHEIFPSLIVDDVFMERVIADEEYTLFSPYDVRDLTETYGEEFKRIYTQHENEFINNPDKYNKETKRIKAKSLFLYVINSYYENGTPFLFFKDNANKAHKYPELGIIRSSNLCTEIMLPTNNNETAVCNLGSVNIAKVNKPEDLERVIKIAVRAMDNCVDLTEYPSEDSKRFQQKVRSIGCGFLGEAELLAISHIEYGSEEHQELLHNVYGNASKYLEEATKELAKEKGSCAVEGVRNAYLSAIAPNSSSGVFACTTSSHEPIIHKIWKEDRKAETITLVAPGISRENEKYYKSAFEIDTITQVRMNGIRQKYIDMGISFNLYVDSSVAQAARIRDIIVEAWKCGLKSTYYLRSKSPTNKDIEEVEIVTSKNGIKCVGCEN